MQTFIQSLKAKAYQLLPKIKFLLVGLFSWLSYGMGHIFSKLFEYSQSDIPDDKEINTLGKILWALYQFFMKCSQDLEKYFNTPVIWTSKGTL